MPKTQEEKEIRKKILGMILPITGENLLQMSAAFITMAMIGRLEPHMIGAVGIGLRVFKIVWALLRGVITGTTVFVAQAYGAEDYGKLKLVVIRSFFSILLITVILQQLIFWNVESLMKFFGASGALLEEGIPYLQILTIGIPFLGIMLVVAGVLQGMGNAKTPMKVAAIMNVINVAVSYLLIFGMGPIQGQGVIGAAWGMIIAQTVAGFLGIYILFNKDGILRGTVSKALFSMKLPDIWPIYRVGLPTAMESVFWQLSSVILTIVILSYGDLAFASYQLGLQAEAISYMPAMGLGVAATAFVGQALGAKDPELARKYLREIIKGGILITGISSCILIFLPHQVMRLLTPDHQVIETAVWYLIFMGLVQLPQNLAMILNGALRGAGHSRVPMIVAGFGIWGVRVPLALISAFLFKMPLMYIWLAISLDLILRFILSLVLYKRKNIYQGKTLIEQTPIVKEKPEPSAS